MRFYVYLTAFFVSIVLAVAGGIGFHFLEVWYESETAKNAHRELQEFLGK